jgi:four helix bundle protein
MSGFSDFTEIRAWQEARSLVKLIYLNSGKTGQLGRDFRFADQMRRAGVSIMSNIAEGFSRGGNREFARFLDIARGSCSELRSLLYVAADVGHLFRAEAELMAEKVQAIAAKIGSLTTYLRTRLEEPTDSYLTKDI